MKKVVLVITDGIGHSEKKEYNAFYHAKTPTYDWLFENVPHSLIATYGEKVGLPANQMGNSEVGHMTLGAGRVIDQDLLKIDKTIKNQTLFNNPAFSHLYQCQNIHLIGLFSDGGVHSHLNHLLCILEQLKDSYKGKIWLHLISDGRDVNPQSLLGYLDRLKSVLDGQVKIATLSGRYYAMDRDNRWERVKLAYKAMVEATPSSKESILEYIQESYKAGVYDEFIVPVAFEGFNGINQEDGVLFYNFRSDRMRELSYSFASKDFKPFKRKISPMYCVCMNEYDENFPLPALLQKDNLKGTLAEILSQNHLTQAHIAETEKYAHVTFFFNGGLEEPYCGEERFLIPSPKVKTYDLLPQMSAKEVGDKVLECMEREFDFVVVNFANGDMVGHTGVFEAGIKAVEAVDCELGRIIAKAKEKDYSMVITSDHGNCEEMRDEEGKILTNHTIGDVWCFVLDSRVTKITSGSLANIAPTVLKLMGLESQEMQKALF